MALPGPPNGIALGTEIPAGVSGNLQTIYSSIQDGRLAHQCAAQELSKNKGGIEVIFIKRGGKICLVGNPHV